MGKKGNKLETMRLAGAKFWSKGDWLGLVTLVAVLAAVVIVYIASGVQTKEGISENVVTQSIMAAVTITTAAIAAYQTGQSRRTNGE